MGMDGSLFKVFNRAFSGTGKHFPPFYVLVVVVVVVVVELISLSSIGLASGTLRIILACWAVIAFPFIAVLSVVGLL